MIKKQNRLTKFFAKNKSVNQLIMKLACPMQHILQKYRFGRIVEPCYDGLL
jgi:hypothetical protein